MASSRQRLSVLNSAAKMGASSSTASSVTDVPKLRVRLGTPRHTPAPRKRRAWREDFTKDLKNPRSNLRTEARRVPFEWLCLAPDGKHKRVWDECAGAHCR